MKLTVGRFKLNGRRDSALGIITWTTVFTPLLNCAIGLYQFPDGSWYRILDPSTSYPSAELALAAGVEAIWAGRVLEQLEALRNSQTLLREVHSLRAEQTDPRQQRTDSGPTSTQLKA